MYYTGQGGLRSGFGENLGLGQDFPCEEGEGVPDTEKGVYVCVYVRCACFSCARM